MNTVKIINNFKDFKNIKSFEVSNLPKLFNDLPKGYSVIGSVSVSNNENLNICVYITDLYESIESIYVFDFKSNKFILNNNADIVYKRTFLEPQHLIQYIYKELNIKYKSQNIQFINHKSILDNFIEIKNIFQNNSSDLTVEFQEPETKFNQDFTLTKSWQQIAFKLDYKDLVCQARFSFKLKKIYFNIFKDNDYNTKVKINDAPKEFLISKFNKELDKNIKYYNNTVNSARKYTDKINIINKLLIDNFPDYLI